MSNLTGVPMELLYASQTAGTAKNTFTTEVAINDTAGMGGQFALPANFFASGRAGRALRVVARGILSSTATPTYALSVRLGAAASITACLAAGLAATATSTTVTNQPWEFEADIVVQAPQAPGANTTLRGTGFFFCGGLPSPFQYPIWGGAASPGTVTTLDTSIANYVNFNAACSASSASNNIQLLQLLVYGQN